MNAADQSGKSAASGKSSRARGKRNVPVLCRCTGRGGAGPGVDVGRVERKGKLWR